MQRLQSPPPGVSDADARILVQSVTREPLRPALEILNILERGNITHTIVGVTYERYFV